MFSRNVPAIIQTDTRDRIQLSGRVTSVIARYAKLHYYHSQMVNRGLHKAIKGGITPVEEMKSASLERVVLNMLRRFGEDAPRQAAIRAAELAVYGRQEDSRFWVSVKSILLESVVDPGFRERSVH